MESPDISELVCIHPDLFDDENDEKECWDISHLVSCHLDDLLGDENKEEEKRQREQEEWFAMCKITLKLIMIYYEEIHMQHTDDHPEDLLDAPVMFHSQSNAKWDDDAHIKFIELCEQEIRKGNRPNTRLSKDGWKNMVNEFNEKMGRKYSRKQMKNHWDYTKAEWTLFKHMIRGETLGWDATKNTIMADDDWWEQKIKENVRYKRFRNKDLSLIWYRYDALFTDVIATGERACGTKQEQMSGIGLDLVEVGMNGVDGYDKGHLTHLNDERIDESDDLENVDSVMFSKPSLKRRKSTDCISASSQVKKSKTEPGVASIKELIHSLIEFLSNNRTATSPASDEPSIETCIDMLGNMSDDIPAGTDLYNYTLNMFLKKEIRQMFVKLPSNEARKSWLEYNHRLFLKKYSL